MVNHGLVDRRTDGQMSVSRSVGWLVGRSIDLFHAAIGALVLMKNM